MAVRHCAYKHTRRPKSLKADPIKSRSELPLDRSKAHLERDHWENWEWYEIGISGVYYYRIWGINPLMALL
jgi:hypothetical protein